MRTFFRLSFTLTLFVCFSFRGISQTSGSSANEILSQVASQQQKNEDKINAAFTAMEAVERAGAYIESLADLFGNGEVTLPVGIKKGDYELIIQKILYNKDTQRSQIYATCAFKFKEDGQPVVFEGISDIEGQKGLGTNGSLQLVAPVLRKLGNKVAIIFNNGTKANFGCEGIESFTAKLSLVITSDKIVPVNASGKPTSEPIVVSFEGTFQNFDSYSVSFNFDRSFCLKGLQDIIFTLNGAILDQDDIETPALVKFPQGYFTSEADNIKLWRGIAITSASVSLPPFLKKNQQSADSIQTPADSISNPADSLENQNTFKDRVTLRLKDVIIDENGFSGFAEGQNIILSEQLNRSNWGISLTDFRVSLLKNEVKGLGFGGDLNIPPLGKNSLLPYSASYNSSTEEYDFKVNFSGEFDFPVFHSTLTVDETSSIEVMIRDSEFYPTLNASGDITINAPINEADTSKKFSAPGIHFENLSISREKPNLTIGAIGVTGANQSPKFAGFDLTISNIQTFDSPATGSGLSFQTGVNLSQMFGGEAGLQLYGDYDNWKFKRVNLNKVGVNFKSGAYSIYGGVEFKNGDTLYGTGFRGDVELSLLDNKFNLDAVAVFGKKDEFRYFLTDVYFETSPESGIFVPPVLCFYGFGGGLYRRMRQSLNPVLHTEFGNSLSGISYIPDNTKGMGFMASTKLGLKGSPSAFNASVAFEMQFNNSGGLNFVQLRGDAAFMDDPKKWGTLAGNINSHVQKLEEAGGTISLSATSDLKVPENKETGFLTASMNINYDIANKVFSADLNTYLNAGFIKGVGANDRMGWASAYFSPGSWHTYIGTPSNRLGIEILGLARSDGYFMIGDNIPELPPPPPKVLQNFSPQMQNRLNTRNTENLASGNGIAFGSSLGVNFNAELRPFYASLGVGMGAEFMLKNYGENAYCAGSSTTLGIGGWYARGQAWAWVEADIGMKATVFGKTRKFSILDISTSALLAGAGPNPIYFTGAVGGHFRVMGGLISGHCNFDFEIGEECKIMTGSPFGEDIIAQLTPAAGETDVNVFAAPQALFNIPLELEMEIEEDDGAKAWYKVTLEEYSVFYKDTKQKIEGKAQLNSQRNIIMLDPTEPFESKKAMVVYAKVGFKRKLNGQWIDVKGSDGKPVFEEKSAEFTSGERPKEILPEHVKFSYPIANQYNFYPEEYPSGYVLITENYSYLFTTDKPQGYDQVLLVEDSDGTRNETDFTYTTYTTSNLGEDIKMEIDFPLNGVSFKNNEIYKLAIVNVPQATLDISGNITTTTTNLTDSVLITENQAEGTLSTLHEKTIYALHFRTSKYSTFSAKMATFDTRSTGWRDYIEPFVHSINANITDDEFFDRNEMQWVNGEYPVIQFQAKLNETGWYGNSIYQSMYGTVSYSFIEYARNAAYSQLNALGYPPTRAVYIQNPAGGSQLTNDEILSGMPMGTYPYGIFTYSLPYWFSRDLFLIKTKLANKAAQGENLSQVELAILTTDHPPVVTQGDYPVSVRYVLPGKNIVTSTVNIVMYNPIN